MNDRNIFNQIVYTPLSEALRLLDERRKDPELMAKVEKLLNGDIPEILKQKKCGVLGRHIATPNHESQMFIKITKEYELFPVFFEYHEDKFTPSSNNYKHSLGQLTLQQNKIDKNGYHLFERITIVDFNKYSGHKISEIKTFWDEPLIDFHKKLFLEHDYQDGDFYAFNGSDWYKNNGGRAEKYYFRYFLMFTCFGILFENFLTSPESDRKFTKEIILPAIEEVINLTGIKPLIVPIGPLDIETDSIWIHHLQKIKRLIPKEYHD